MSTRNPAVAGMFYPSDPAELSRQISSLLKQAKKSKSGPLRALILPHAGYVYSGIVAAAGYRLLLDADFHRVMLLGPSHHAPLRAGAFDTSDHWRTPLGSVTLWDFPSQDIVKDAAAHSREHSLEVQVPFIQTVLPGVRVCPIALGNPINPLGLLANLDEKTLLIVSSDLSHYLSYDKAVKTDQETIARILSLHDVERACACGADGINTLLRIAKRRGWTPTLLDYRNSGDTSGDKSGVVGYAAIAFMGD